MFKWLRPYVIPMLVAAIAGAVIVGTAFELAVHGY
jgi:hypothetical protein